MALTKQLMVYPANRLEDLAVLLNHVVKLGQQSGALGVFTSAQVVVENPGMQHWLNTELAKQDGIAMNINFPLPGKFVWQLARQLLGDTQVPQQPPYQREALVWRIDGILASDAIANNQAFIQANQYWQSGSKDKASAPTDALLKRFQLASALADLYEQYILYRPDWLTQWQTQIGVGHWQAQLWAILCQQDGRHPIDIQKKLLQKLDNLSQEQKDGLPQQVCLFALNTMAPATLEVFSALAAHIQVHVFHLNPCAEYWGHIQSEKAIAASHLARWLEQNDDQVLVDGGNPLLANLGSQGKEFFRLLQQQDSYNIEAFEEAQPQGENQKLSVLGQVQKDILYLHDASLQIKPQIDDSLVFTSSSSALRELQGLHDWLLMKFQEDPTLKPSDVLVMCPQVEDYAHYVGSVFDTQAAQFGTHFSPNNTQATPKIPCSIADRKPQDSEPLVAAFLQLLQLPDSRFQVSFILDFLRLPAIQRTFGINPVELETIEVWLANACVHWGINAEHKASILGQQEASLTHSWAWGLKRLLLGFAHGTSSLYQDSWLLEDVEGDQALLLGRLMQVLEKLQRHTQKLAKARTGPNWRDYLTGIIDEFFADDQSAKRDEEMAKEYLSTAIGNMAMWVEQVGYTQTISLDVVRYSLTQKLSVANTSQAFLTGKVTFCSMVPMRSIPFKIVAMLGLNDGQYPRQSTPIDFDLMAQEERRPGDRSRRGDDRYLFLEALISARSCLYLSYQGIDSKSNSPRQPSLVVSELMNYLCQGYGWSFDAKNNNSQLMQLPLHGFSESNFSTSEGFNSTRQLSFEADWLRVIQASQPLHELEEPASLLAQTGLNEPSDMHEAITISDLVNFLENPGRLYAHKHLGLYLKTYDLGLEDDEPFESSALVQHQLRQSMLDAVLSGDPNACEQVWQQYQNNGQLPDSPIGIESLEKSHEEALKLAEKLNEEGYQQIQMHPFSHTEMGFSIEDEIPLVQPIDAEGPLALLLQRPAKAKPKDQLSLWLTSLVAQVVFNKEVLGVSVHLDKKLKLEGLIQPQQQLSSILNYYALAKVQPLPLDVELGITLSKLDPLDIQKRHQTWQKKWTGDQYSLPFEFSNDPYRLWLWPQAPSLDDWQEPIEQLYQPMLKCIKVVKNA